jgi:hypothetical protein
MQVKVKIDAVGTPLDTYIEKNLTQVGLPTCFGSMIPPIIKRQVLFDDLSILKDREAVSENQIAVDDISEIVDGAKTYCSKRVMDKKGVEKIEEYKEKRAEKYTAQLLKCSQCKFIDICDKLTNNYLRVISVQEMIKLQDILKSKGEI